MERKSGPIALRDSVVAIAVSFLFFYLGFAQFFFVFPLLLLSTQLGKGVSLISIAVEMALVVLYVVLTSSGGALALPFALFELYIPLSLLAAGVIWLMTEKKSAGLRLLFSILPSALFFIILYVYLEQDPALLENIIGVYEDAFEALLGPFLNSEMVSEEVIGFVCRILLLVTVSMIVPLVLCFVCVTCFSYESVLHSRESDWEDRVARFELDGRVIWIFLALWLMILLSRFVSMPTMAGIALFNGALSFTVCYAVQGFSVLCYNMRKRGRRIRSFSFLMILLAIALFIPGINIVIVLALPLIGVLETFIELRK